VRIYTDREGGEVRPKRPIEGKEKPGITFCRRELREVYFDATKEDQRGAEGLTGQKLQGIENLAVG
jgi:hypothetical protein